MGLKILGARLLIEQAPMEEKVNGIILPDQSQAKPRRGKVIKVGPGAYFDNGMLKSVEIPVGVDVIYADLQGVPIKDPTDHKEYLLINERDILAIVTEEN